MADEPTQRLAPAAERERALDLMRARRDAEGLAALAQLNQAYPDDRDVMGHYAFACLNQREWAAADRLLAQLQSTPDETDSWEGYYYRAWAQAAQGHHDRALDLCTQAVQRAPRRIRPRELGATLALRTHRPEQGLALLKPVGDRGLLSRLVLLDRYRDFSLANPCVSLWMLCCYFARQQQAPTQVPTYARGWVTAACGALGRVIAAPPLPGRPLGCGSAGSGASGAGTPVSAEPATVA